MVPLVLLSARLFIISSSIGRVSAKNELQQAQEDRLFLRKERETTTRKTNILNSFLSNNNDDDCKHDCKDDGVVMTSNSPSVSSTNYDVDPLSIAILIEEVREEIRSLIRQNRDLAPKFVRLGFHDCVGGCDGCVDMSESDNNGLNIPMDALSSTVSKWKGTFPLSRADIWALAALTGSEMTQSQEEFHMDYIGRIDCEDTGRDCFDKEGQTQECRYDLGDFQQMPGPNLLTHEILDFFADTFGFEDPRDVVLLMGAHSIGTATKSHSGFDGPVGWDDTNYFLDVDYYKKLIGGGKELDGSDVDLEDLMEAAPGWTQETVDNNNGGGIPDRMQWFRGRSLDEDLRNILALNTDVGLCRDLSSAMSNNGAVSCNFKNPSRCPVATQTMDLMKEYRFDEPKFLQDFEIVFKKVLTAGYDVDTGELIQVPQLTEGEEFNMVINNSPKISSAKTSYDSGEEITLSFENPSSQRMWISIQRANTDPLSITRASEAWASACGSQDCTEQSLPSGSFSIGNVGDGLWRAYMVYDMTWPYEAVAFSESFSVGGTKISTSKSCYSGEEMVRLSFSNPVGSRVWIAIFPEDTDPSNISGSSQNWAWPCGSQGCRGDSLTSNEFDISVEADGMWRAFLMNDMYAPYKSLAYSNSFEVKSTSGNCPDYFISVSKGAYLPNEPVVINFENPLGTRIWFGVYEASADPTNLNYSQSEDYVYPCGDKTCTDKSLTSGTVTLNNVEAEGNWRVYLISFSDTWPYQALAFTKDEIMVRSTVSIATSKSSYSSSEVVIVNYVNPSNERFWMGVYESSADPTNLNDSQSEDWAWPCGDKDCTEQSLSSGTVKLYNVGEGSWRVYFITDMTWPYESVTYSEEFTVDS